MEKKKKGPEQWISLIFGSIIIMIILLGTVKKGYPLFIPAGLILAALGGIYGHYRFTRNNKGVSWRKASIVFFIIFIVLYSLFFVLYLLLKKIGIDLSVWSF